MTKLGSHLAVPFKPKHHFEPPKNAPWISSVAWHLVFNSSIFEVVGLIALIYPEPWAKKTWYIRQTSSGCKNHAITRAWTWRVSVHIFGDVIDRAIEADPRVWDLIVTPHFLFFDHHLHLPSWHSRPGRALVVCLVHFATCIISGQNMSPPPPYRPWHDLIVCNYNQLYIYMCVNK